MGDAAPPALVVLRWLAVDGSLVATRSWHALDGSGDVNPGAIATDRGGNVLLTGYFYRAVDLGGLVLEPQSCAECAGWQAFVVKLGPAGDPLWARAFSARGPMARLEGTTLTADAAGNVIVAGVVRGDVDFGPGTLTGAADGDTFIVKLDPEGAVLWSRRAGDDAEQYRPEAVCADPAGNIALAAPLVGTVTFGDQGAAATPGAWLDGFVAKLDAGGESLWVTALAEDQTGGAACDAQGDVYAAGNGGLHKLDAATGEVLWQDATRHLWRVWVDDCDNAIAVPIQLTRIVKRAPDGATLADWSIPTIPVPCGGLNFDKTTTALTRDGTLYYVDAFASPIDFGAGAVTGSILLRMVQP